MTGWKVALQSFVYYLRSNLTIALGVAAATAVLTGALIVGDSMRGSLRDLTLDRLGQVDEILVSDGFFREALASELSQSKTFQEHYDNAIPGILFPNGTVEVQTAVGVERAANVNVFGVADDFWALGEGLEGLQISGREVVMNQSLADQFSISDDSQFTLRIPKPSQLPADSALGKTRDLVESLQRLKVKQVVPNKSLARFSLHPSQAEPANLFVPLKLLQDSLNQTALKFKSDSQQVNVIFLDGKGQRPPKEAITEELKKSLEPRFDDLGFASKDVIAKFTSEGAEKRAFEYCSISSDRLVVGDEAASAIQKAFPNAQPVFTYLANDIRKSSAESGVPYSMIASIDFSDQYRLESAESGQPIRTLNDQEIVLNEWTAKNLGVKVGDSILISFFEPETTHGVQVESSIEFELVDIAKLTKPATPFLVRRRGDVRPAIFDQAPTLANDPDLTPAVPGVTDAESIEKWDLPFETKNRLRPVDDEYWNDFRTTPKGFISLAAGQSAWNSRFGKVTSFRVAMAQGSQEEVNAKILSQFKADGTDTGFDMVPLKRQGLLASGGSTPFDVLFLSLSMFVIAAALILVSLLFRLALQERINQVGLFSATGFTHKKIVKIWLLEAVLLSAVGALVGVACGVGYAALMIWGLKTWWVGAISRPFLEMHVGWISLLGGLLSGLVVSVATIVWAIWRTRKIPTHQLLSGNIDQAGMLKTRKRGWLGWAAIGMILLAVVLAVVATQLGGEAQAGSFVGAGFLILTALLVFVWQWLQRSKDASENQLDLNRMAWLSARRNPLRSTLTIGLVAVAAFLIASISSFHLSPLEEGTAGFDWVAESSQPVFEDLNTSAGQIKALGQENQLPDDARVLSLRVKPGQDASCNNLYQSTQPRVLGVTKQMVEYFDNPERTAFAFAGANVETDEEKQNPWRALWRESEGSEGSIRVLIDKNTAWYSLKVFMIGQEFTVNYDSGETVTFKVAGFLSNTILQGSLLVSEENFEKAFPNISGYRFFLIDDGESDSASTVGVLEDRLGDNGFDARDAKAMLTSFLAVQNTYLSTFQTLGALGLLLGTFGLGAVQIRNVLERQREFGLMRAVGWGLNRLSRMVMLETVFLLMLGLAIGILSALFATLPHYFVGAATIPVTQLLVMFGVIVIVGLITALITSRVIFKMPLLESLRD
jgi:ABC-type antimicrobial peptide transport system permease subunit